MIKIRDISLPVGSGENEIKRRVAEIIGISEGEILDFSLSKISVDARKKSDVHLVCTATLSLENETHILEKVGTKNILAIEPVQYTFPELKRKSPHRPIIVGMGPAGLFCALHLARAGCPTIILERGKPVTERVLDVERFWETGVLNEKSNIQFGEGGAGTFSDGKLSTGIKDSRVSHVFQVFCEHGAARDILWSAKPHIGTDVLRNVVESVRKELITLGCEVRFEQVFDGFSSENGDLTAVQVEHKGEHYEIPCDTLILAPGHSARDTFEMLYENGVKMEQKPFAVGVRIEHLQDNISRTQYGAFAEKLAPADYKLACHLPNGRSAYSFCVCPGGQIVAAASEQGRIAINGMSYRARDGKNINGGFLVGVKPEDFGGSNPLAGMHFQRYWEERAFQLGGGNFTAPAQTVGAFLTNNTEKRGIEPTYKPGVKYVDLAGCLPDFVTTTLKTALPILDKQLRGFSDENAVMTGIESRSSSPVRIVRGQDFQTNIRGVFPCGEGAGYAGGITSAAVDGIKVAEYIATSV